MERVRCTVSRPPVPSVPLLARWPARLATKGSRRAVNASHELLSSPLGGGTNSCPHLGGSGASMLGLLSEGAVTF